MDVSNASPLVNELLALHSYKDADDYASRRDLLVRRLISVAQQPERRLNETGAELLAVLDSDDAEAQQRANRALHVLFDVIEGQRITSGVRLVERALVHRAFLWKERCIELIDEFADVDSIPALIEALRRYAGTSEVTDLDTRAAAIRALTYTFQAKHVKADVLPYLQDAAATVRLAAVEYVCELDIAEAGDTLISRLPEEPDPAVFELSLECIEMWQRHDALPVCKKLLQTIPPRLTSFTEPLAATISTLSR